MITVVANMNKIPDNNILIISLSRQRNIYAKNLSNE